VEQRDIRVGDDPISIWSVVESSDPKQIVVSPDPVGRALNFYNLNLRANLEASNVGQVVAIHPDTFDYEISARPGRARRALRSRHPEGPIIVHVIGVNTTLADRLRGDRVVE
jgi:hypothetical protein